MRLKALMERHSISQTDLARILGRDKAVVTNLFQGRRRLKADEAMRIAQHLGVSMEEMLGDQAPAGLDEPRFVPFHHTPTHARKSRQVIKQGGKFYLEDAAAQLPKAYALEVLDDSLNLLGFLPGDIAISQLDLACRPGQIVVAQHYLEAGAITMLRRYDPPFLMPHSTNPVFRPMSAESEEIRLVSPVIKLVRLL